MRKCTWLLLVLSPHGYDTFWHFTAPVVCAQNVVCFVLHRVVCTLHRVVVLLHAVVHVAMLLIDCQFQLDLFSHTTPCLKKLCKSVFVWWRELGEVENECISHNFSLFTIFLPKIIKIGGNLTKFWQKQFCTVFLRHGVYTFSPHFVLPVPIIFF